MRKGKRKKEKLIITLGVVGGMILFLLAGIGLSLRSGKLSQSVETVKKTYAKYKGRDYIPPAKIQIAH